MLNRFVTTSLARNVIQCSAFKGLNLINLSNHIMSTPFSHIQSSRKPIRKHDWHTAIREAEKIFGSSTSFLKLRWLMSDDIANLGLYMKRVADSSHSLLKTAKNLIYAGQSSLQECVLIVLLISKAAGHSSHMSDLEKDESAGVLHSQRTLAEITEMIRISSLFHQDMANLQTFSDSGNELAADSELIFGNKIALLGGDYLLVNAWSQLANLRNQDLLGLITSAVRDLAESNFIGDRDDENVAIPSNPKLKVNLTNTNTLEDFDNTKNIDMSLILGHAEREWTFRHTLSLGSLIGKSCQGTLKLADQPEDLQKHGFAFGKHMALAWQSSMDLEPFELQEFPLNGTFSLVSAQVLYHLDYDPSLYEEIEKGRQSVSNIDYRKIHKIVADGPGIKYTKELQRKHGQKALDVLNKLPGCDARSALQNLIWAMQYF